MGLAILLVFLAYLLIALGIVAWAARLARSNGRSPWRWGGLAALVMYLIPFWDWLPTVAMHRYYCHKEAGFWVYKSLEKWQEENPGVLETLIDNSTNERYPNWPSESWNGRKITSINQRLGLLYINHISNASESKIPFNVWRWKTELVDKQTGAVLARQINFSSGNNGYIGGMHSKRFWLYTDSCSEGGQE